MNCTAVKKHLVQCKECRAAKRTLRPSQLPLDKLHPFPHLRQVERLFVREALKRTGQNITHAAAALGITREGLRKKMIRLGIP